MSRASFDARIAILREVRTIAVIGAHHRAWKAACYVPEYLASMGYRILPVNPRFVGLELFGERVVASLVDLEEPVDLVNVFRRSEDVPAHVPEILAMNPLPAYVWLQLGIVNDAACEAFEAAGIRAVQDACTLADHRRARL